MINGIHHAAISTPNMERAILFYRDLLGAEVITDYQWQKGEVTADRIVGLKDSSARVVLLRLGNAMIELFEYLSPSPKLIQEKTQVCDHGFSHICLDVSDIKAEYERLAAEGMEFNCPPQHLGAYIATYGRDPDGNVIELQEVVDMNGKYALDQKIEGAL